jgi:hypothetical protein
MPGLVPGIHVFGGFSSAKAWMAGTSPAMTKETAGKPIRVRNHFYSGFDLDFPLDFPATFPAAGASESERSAFSAANG